MFEDLVELTGIGTDSRLLELGAGTGKATAPLAAMGCRIVAVEPGPNLAAVAARNLAAFPDVHIVTATFEHWPLPDQPFDLVLAATAYHWLDPSLRVAKTAKALRPGGALAVTETHHVAGGDHAFFADVQACYERFDPDTTPGMRLPASADVPRRAETDRSGQFDPAVFRRYPWQATYTTGGYLDLLMTYSGHRALPPPARAGLLDCIAHLIESRYRGQVTKQYLTQLWVAHRRHQPTQGPKAGGRGSGRPGW